MNLKRNLTSGLEAMKTVSFILILVGLSVQVNAQFRLPEGLDNSQSTPSFQKKIDYSFSTGTSFFSSPGYAHGSSFYLAPEFKMNLSPKFKVDAGIMLMQNRFNWNPPTSVFGERSVVVKSGPSYGGVLFASGNYQLNSRLTFSGCIVKSFSPDGSSYQAGMQNSYQMMSLGVDYKLSDHITIGGGVRMMQFSGFNPYLGNYGYGPMNNFWAH